MLGPQDLTHETPSTATLACLNNETPQTKTSPPATQRLLILIGRFEEVLHIYSSCHYKKISKSVSYKGLTLNTIKRDNPSKGYNLFPFPPVMLFPVKLTLASQYTLQMETCRSTLVMGVSEK